MFIITGAVPIAYSLFLHYIKVLIKCPTPMIHFCIEKHVTTIPTTQYGFCQCKNVSLWSSCSTTVDVFHIWWWTQRNSTQIEISGEQTKESISHQPTLQKGYFLLIHITNTTISQDNLFILPKLPFYLFHTHLVLVHSCRLLLLYIFMYMSKVSYGQVNSESYDWIPGELVNLIFCSSNGNLYRIDSIVESPNSVFFFQVKY